MLGVSWLDGTKAGAVIQADLYYIDEDSKRIVAEVR